MKSQSKLRNLSPEDQQYVLDLCQDRRYEDVVPILAQPRPVGLAITTSVSALCRFYNQVNPLGLRAAVASQLADGLQLRQHLSGLAFNEAILTLVQVHLLDSLKNGKTIEELQFSFRTLHNLQRNWLAFERLRRENDNDDEIVAIHKHDEAFLENEPDFTEIPASETEPSGAPLSDDQPVSAKPNHGHSVQSAAPEPPAPCKIENAQCATPDKTSEETETLPPNSAKNTPSFHLFHQIPLHKNSASAPADPLQKHAA